MSAGAGFRPPAYPYDQLAELRAKADRLEGGVVDLSVGTPCDPPPASVVGPALACLDRAGPYPASVGSPGLRQAAADWMRRRLGVEVDPDHVAACVGTKEFVGTLPAWLRRRHPSRDTVLYPAVSYPTYEMGALVAGCRAVPVPVGADGALCLDQVPESEAERALALWVNSPSNPTGRLDDLAAAASWGRERGVPVFSDECYVEFTWVGPRRSVLQSGSSGVVAVHSLSKRSNMAGMRVGFYAGDPELVGYLSEVRKHVGMMVPGPVQEAARLALEDDAHVEEQRRRYHQRIELFCAVLGAAGLEAVPPEGGFYLWVEAPQGDWALADRLALEAGVLVSPGSFFGREGAGHVRAAMVQPTGRLELAARRLGVAPG
ncbi:MAG TPA: aminotransferase class I/II-fold pyridoxal phosphate-dependent enzyme [Acidimicrobiales bacterium]|nr:aminotransferase class I/II-fold pyridoxal phosphate-dependent enzyme [Acidimicrobiales bacterium]